MVMEIHDGAIVIPRPLSELKNHITHFEIPNLYVIARAVKVCGMAVFLWRWHLYDIDAVLIKRDTTYIHSLNGPVAAETPAFIEAKRRYLFKSADIFTPRTDQFKDRIEYQMLSNYRPLSLLTAVIYLRTLGDEEFKKGALPWTHPEYAKEKWVDF